MDINAIKIEPTINLNFDKSQHQPKKIGIINKGKSNKFIDNKFSGLDVGIQDEGENTLAVGNVFEEN